VFVGVNLTAVLCKVWRVRGILVCYWIWFRSSNFFL